MPRRLWCLDNLPAVRCFLYGPRWQRSFGVEQRPIAEVRPPWMDRCRDGRRWVLVFSLEEDIRERVLEEIRPGVVAQFSYPLERLGL